MERPQRTYDLKKMYGRESAAARYRRLTAGEGASYLDLAWQEAVLGLCGWLPGGLGLLARSLLYPLCFKGFHRTAYIGRYATLRCPRQIRLERDVLVDDFVQLIATSRNREAIRIGEGTFLRSFAMLNAGPPDGYIHVGRSSSIGQGALLYGNGGLTIGDHVLIAGQSAIIASSHIFDRPDLPMSDQGYSAEGIVIADNVWIGAGARILDGVTIGEGAIVGANAVVNRSVAPGDRVGGIPARSLKQDPGQE
jgi:acetyltransferase-like isoleucine patch superfamily enzyme